MLDILKAAVWNQSSTFAKFFLRDMSQQVTNLRHLGPVVVAQKVVGARKFKKGKRKVQGVPQSQTAALPRPQEEEETDKSKQAQTEQTYEKH